MPGSQFYFIATLRPNWPTQLILALADQFVATMGYYNHRLPVHLSVRSTTQPHEKLYKTQITGSSNSKLILYVFNVSEFKSFTFQSAVSL